jgi:hypothetical protein
VIFTKYVGVAPGTTTLGEAFDPFAPYPKPPAKPCATCPKDLNWYMTPPPMPSSKPGAVVVYDPYATESRLNGLGVATGIRWDIVAAVGGVAFLAAFAVGLLSSRR